MAAKRLSRDPKLRFGYGRRSGGDRGFVTLGPTEHELLSSANYGTRWKLLRVYMAGAEELWVWNSQEVQSACGPLLELCQGHFSGIYIDRRIRPKGL